LNATPPTALFIILCKRGLPIPVDLYVMLINEGHDVEALERKYRV
jgi:hypothetical protein